MRVPGRTSRRLQVQVKAFKTSEKASAAESTSSDGKQAIQSRVAVFQEVEESSKLGNVYGKPLSRSEQNALQAACSHWSSATTMPAMGKQGMQEQLLKYLQEAASSKQAPLNLVEGAMVVLEQLFLMEARKQQEGRTAGDGLQGVWSPEEQLYRWQLVIGADVGSIQYIPVVEELEVAGDGASFNLDTDLNLVFTGFSGDSSWLAPSHLRYHVQRVRVEFRPPEGWDKPQEWLNWRSRPAISSADALDDGMAAAVAEPPSTCRPDPSRSALELPLPFPENELFIFCSNGDAAVLRSKLGGLIMLVNKTPAGQRASLAASKRPESS